MFEKAALIFLFLFRNSICGYIDPMIQLPTGTILGREALTCQNNSYFAFEGIPYAAPPIGDLRFKPPQPPNSWIGILNATYSDVACYQIGSHDVKESESCLRLNVFAPNRPSGEDQDLMPVMLFIHGGAFNSGTSGIYLPGAFMDHGVILVTVNYRLGLFGFLSTQDDVIPGNNALKDQLQAIKWTHENIYTFGGDPEKITIFGESAGSASAAFQLLNQKSEGLFRGAILQSGTFLSLWAYQENARDIAFGTAALLNFTSDSSQELLEFLQNVDVKDLSQAAELYANSQDTAWGTIASKGLVWSPVIEIEHDDAFVTEKMYQSLKAGNLLKVPTVIGFNSEESLLFNPDPDATSAVLPFLDEHLDLLVPDGMRIFDADNRTELGRQIRDIYTKGESFTDNAGYAIRYASDNTFIRSIIRHAELFSSFADTYLYQFSYDGQLGNINVHYDNAECVGHAEELHYLFFSAYFCDVDPSDSLTRQRLIKLWTNFAKYQNPTPESSNLLPVTWPQVSIDNNSDIADFSYLDIGEDLQVKSYPKEETYREWKSLYDGLGYDDFVTY